MPESRGPTVAAVLIVKDEAADLPRCLASLDWVDEIVVVDDHSRDDTAAIAEAAGAKVFQRALDRFDTQRNFGIEQSTSEWILSLDADEVVPATLAAEIRETVARADAADLYGIPFRQRLLGRWPAHGGWGHPLNRLSRRHLRWRGAVHERIEPGESYGLLEHPILHYSHASIAEFIGKLNRYTEPEAAARVAEGHEFSPWKLALSPVRDFFHRYVVQRGYRDGVVGLVLAMLMAFYIFTVRAKAWELNHPADEPEPEV